MRVLFNGDTLNYRGTTVALTDYAKYNQEVLGNESIITYNASLGYEKDMGTEIAVVNELKKRFQVIGYEQDGLEKIISYEKIDLAYFIRAGSRENLPTNCKTAIHAVFQFNDPHGDKYAYVSKWLSDEMSQGTIPYVPHIVELPLPTGTYRDALNISSDKIVIGRLGGYYTFDIPEVKNYIIRLVNSTDKFVFLFVGTEPFINHPNVKFINELHSPQKKSNFINTCDAMLHARLRGESFGLSIAEFLSQNKPVFAWNGGYDKNHIDMLKSTGTLYNNETDLNYFFHNIPEFKKDWSTLVHSYNPKSVMQKFNEVFLSV